MMIFLKSKLSSLSENESITSMFLSTDDRYLLVNLSVQVSFKLIILGNSFMGFGRKESFGKIYWTKAGKVCN